MILSYISRRIASPPGSILFARWVDAGVEIRDQWIVQDESKVIKD